MVGRFTSTKSLPCADFSTSFGSCVSSATPFPATECSPGGERGAYKSFHHLLRDDMAGCCCPRYPAQAQRFVMRRATAFDVTAAKPVHRLRMILLGSKIKKVERSGGTVSLKEDQPHVALGIRVTGIRPSQQG